MSAETPTQIEPPRPPDDAFTKFFWDGIREHKLLILRCQSCGRYVHLPRPVCGFCLSDDLTPSEVSGRGHIYSFTVARRAFHPFFADRLPYVLAVVELVEQQGLRMLSNIIDCTTDSVTIGSEVDVTFAAIAPDLILPLFRLQHGERGGQ